MTDREKAIVMAYTGEIMFAGKKMQIYYDYLKELFGREINTCELAYMRNQIHFMAKDDFAELCKG